MQAGELVESRPIRTREGAIERVIPEPGPVVAGFDFSFSVPEWFACEHGCGTVEEVWELAAEAGARWLLPTPPFWNDRCRLSRTQQFRFCEEKLKPAKSVFQLVGPGQVGRGSVRGMPLLRRLRAEGFAIWPFDNASPRTVVEIYPRVLRPLVPDAGPFGTDDERDAVCSALVMWEHREVLQRLPAATDPRTRLEGDIWIPAAISP